MAEQSEEHKGATAKLPVLCPELSGAGLAPLGWGNSALAQAGDPSLPAAAGPRVPLT